MRILFTIFMIILSIENFFKIKNVIEVTPWTPLEITNANTSSSKN